MGALIVSGVVAAIVSTTLRGAVEDTRWAAVLPIAVLLATAAYLIVRFQYKDDADAIDLFEAILAPALFMFPGPVVVAITGVALLSANVARRNEPVKALFNAAQWMSAAGIGALVFASFRQGTTLSPRNTAALVLALVAVTLVNQVAFASVLSIVRESPLRQVLRGLAPVIMRGWIVGWAVNVAFGLLFVAAATWSPFAVALFAVPLLALHEAHRGHAEALADRARLAGMHRATRALAGPVDPREAIPTFLAAVRQCFEASAVDLVVVGDGARTVHRVRGEVDEYITRGESWSEGTLAATLLARAVPVRLSRASADPVTAALLELEGWRDCIAAPLIDGERTLGILCVYERGGLQSFEQGEMAVLEALAGEAARAMGKATLLETILEERSKLSEIVGRTSDGILTVDPTGRIRSWNSALERITGHRAARMLGRRRFAELQARDANGEIVALDRWARDDVSPPSDLQIVTRSGDTRWLSCSYTRVADAEGRPSTLIVVARDTTEVRELEMLKDDFVATVSHELRTPLTPIKGWAMTLLQLGEHLEPRQREEGVQTILRHAERLEKLITNILEVSRIERGLADRREALVDVRTVTEKVVEEFRAQHPKRRIELDVAFGGYSARGDEVWIEQIVSNLLSNAMKYAPEGRPVDVRMYEKDGLIEVSVRDYGPGIPAHETERIFERFKRLGDHMTRTRGGSGLGLYIARQLARAIGGDLTVETEPGRGATFSLRLAVASELAPAAAS